LHDDRPCSDALAVTNVVQKFFDRMTSRPAVRKALKDEGF